MFETFPCRLTRLNINTLAFALNLILEQWLQFVGASWTMGFRRCSNKIYSWICCRDQMKDSCPFARDTLGASAMDHKQPVQLIPMYPWMYYNKLTEQRGGNPLSVKVQLWQVENGPLFLWCRQPPAPLFFLSVPVSVLFEMFVVFILSFCANTPTQTHATHSLPARCPVFLLAHQLLSPVTIPAVSDEGIIGNNATILRANSPPPHPNPSEGKHKCFTPCCSNHDKTFLQNISLGTAVCTAKSLSVNVSPLYGWQKPSAILGQYWLALCWGGGGDNGYYVPNRIYPLLSSVNLPNCTDVLINTVQTLLRWLMDGLNEFSWSVTQIKLRIYSVCFTFLVESACWGFL